MNEASQVRLVRAKAIAQVYARHPDGGEPGVGLYRSS